MKNKFFNVQIGKSYCLNCFSIYLIPTIILYKEHDSEDGSSSFLISLELWWIKWSVKLVFGNKVLCENV